MNKMLFDVLLQELNRPRGQDTQSIDYFLSPANLILFYSLLSLLIKYPDIRLNPTTNDFHSEKENFFRKLALVTIPRDLFFFCRFCFVNQTQAISYQHTAVIKYSLKPSYTRRREWDVHENHLFSSFRRDELNIILKKPFVLLHIRCSDT